MRYAGLTALALLFPPAAASADEGQLVATRVLEPGPHDLTLPEKLGLLEAGEQRSLAFDAPGRLAFVAAEGTDAAEGEVIVELDNDFERARLRQMELRLRQARSEYERVSRLRASKVASAKSLDEAQTLVALRTAERDAAQEQLERRVLVAPFAGVVAEIRVEPDEVVQPGEPVVSFMDLSSLRLEVGVPGYQVGSVRARQDVRVTLPALPGDEFSGVVHRVALAAKAGGNLFVVEIRLANPDERLRPGMSARARIITRSLDSALLVPVGATVERDGNRVAFFADEGRARSVSLIEAIPHGQLFVLTELPSYRELVIRGQRDLRAGDPVRVDNRVLEGAVDVGARSEVRP